MKRICLVFALLSFVTFSFAQEKVDTLSHSQINVDRLQLTVEKPLLLDEHTPLNRISLFEPFNFKQPFPFDISKNIDFKKLLKSKLSIAESYSFSGNGFFPFPFSGNVFNQASYRISDRFTVGGNSFGIQSFLEQPQINPAIQNMSTKGVGMYMKYNVSKNIKIETRVSISNH